MIKTNLAEILTRPDVWRMGAMPRCKNRSLSTGFTQLDTELPDAGWPQGTLTEILCDRNGIGEMSLMLPTLRQVSDEGRNIVFVAPPYIPFARALEANNVRLDRLFVIDAAKANLTWVVEQVIKSKACGILLAWEGSGGLNYTQLRRLQLSADGSDATCVLYRSGKARHSPSAAPLRMALEAAEGELCVDIIKRRGSLASKTIRIPLYPSYWKLNAIVANPPLQKQLALVEGPNSSPHDMSA